MADYREAEREMASQKLRDMCGVNGHSDHDPYDLIRVRNFNVSLKLDALFCEAMRTAKIIRQKFFNNANCRNQTEKLHYKLNRFPEHLA